MLDRCLRVAVAKRDYSRAANASSKDDEESTHFGFQTVKESEKAERGKDPVISPERILVPLSLVFLLFEDG